MYFRGDFARSLPVAAGITLALWSGIASAIPRGDGEPPRAPQVEEPEPPETDEPPPPRQRGMTTAFRLGAGVPFGRVASGPGNGMPDAFAYQVPIVLESGYRPIPALLIGGYLGLAFGDVGGDLRRECRSCATRSFRAGLEGIVFFRPAERLNPWVGLGAGYESILIFADGRSLDLGGPEIIHVLGGLDVRASRKAGFGLYADASLGIYTSTFRQWTASSPTWVGGEGRSEEADIAGRALHGWATAGVRVIFYP